MTDAHLRQLERQFRATGTREDEAAWLRARVQAGELDDDRQRLLAYLGRPVPDREVVAPPSGTPHELGRWVHDLPHRDGARPFPWAVELFGRVGAALARAIPGEELDAAQPAARLLDRWIAAPTDAHAQDVIAHLDDVGRRIEAGRRRGERAFNLLRVVALAMTPASQRWPEVAVNTFPALGATLLAEELGVDPVRDALLGELVPWALGAS